MSHLGRPDGFVNLKYSLKPVAEELSQILSKALDKHTSVTFLPDCVGSATVEYCKNKVADGEVVLLENLRFYPEEEGSSVDSAGKKVIFCSFFYVNNFVVYFVGQSEAGSY